VFSSIIGVIKCISRIANNARDKGNVLIVNTHIVCSAKEPKCFIGLLIFLEDLSRI
jgi:hypothetical protein